MQVGTHAICTLCMVLPIATTGILHSCRSFTTQPSVNMDTESPGLVEDGTKCGNGQVCQSQRCVSVTTAQCATAPNGQICSGNGVRSCMIDIPPP